jgi:hypothetical protein
MPRVAQPEPPRKPTAAANAAFRVTTFHSTTTATYAAFSVTTFTNVMPGIEMMMMCKSSLLGLNH